ncbi:MAG: DUF6054 family protein [Clostridiales bacterium]|jgi:hypothetical protein|nr:DUF6054 family protein [Clostridiales bacterium]
MAKYERHLSGNFDSLLDTLNTEILGRSISASFQDGSDFKVGNVRCAVRVYERYSIAGGNRLAANITLLGDGNDLRLSVIASGGSQAMFFKLNTWGEDAFAEKIIRIVEDWHRHNTKS